MKRLLSMTAAALLGGGLSATIVAGTARADDTDLIARGRYVATLGDCAACHTLPRGGGEDYAGGYPLKAPMGTIWSTNITPSKRYGIGDYSLRDFDRALRRGVRKDGSHLYPAMPYDAYAGMTDADVEALYTYLMQGVKPVDRPAAQVTDLPFPFGLRGSMAAWNWLYAGGRPFSPSAELTGQQNRGKYLVDTLGHCASCHSPRDLLMGTRASSYLQGGAVGPWLAPDITGNPVTGIGSWSDAEVATYLKTGRAEGRAQAAGPMAEAVEHSFQHADDADLLAIAAYLKTLDAAPGAAPSRDARGAPASDEAAIRGMFPQNAHDSLGSGAALYSGYCASCHQPDGAGSEGQDYPALYHNSVTGAVDPTNLIATMLYGVDREAGGRHVLMPHFNTGSYVQALDDQQIADIASYVRSSWGDAEAAPVTAAEVRVVRSGGPVALLVRLQPWIPLATACGAVLLVLLLAAGLRRRRRAA